MCRTGGSTLGAEGRSVTGSRDTPGSQGRGQSSGPRDLEERMAFLSSEQARLGQDFTRAAGVAFAAISTTGLCPDALPSGGSCSQVSRAVDSAMRKKHRAQPNAFVLS